jgi:hypothetical protein
MHESLVAFLTLKNHRALVDSDDINV